jgi:hypothetical protein
MNLQLKSVSGTISGVCFLIAGIVLTLVGYGLLATLLGGVGVLFIARNLTWKGASSYGILGAVGSIGLAVYYRHSGSIVAFWLITAVLCLLSWLLAVRGERRTR